MNRNRYLDVAKEYQLVAHGTDMDQTEMTRRCQPVADLICHALKKSLRRQLGKGPHETLTSSEVAALRLAIDSEDRSVLDEMSLLVHQQANDDESDIEHPAETSAVYPRSTPRRDVHEQPSPAELVTIVQRKPNVIRQDSHLFPLGAMSSERATYQQVDVAHLLRNITRCMGVECHDIATYDENNDGLVQHDELNKFLTTKMGVQLLEAEIQAIQDLLENSLGTIRMTDLVTFLENGQWRSERYPGRLAIPRKNTVTTVAISPDSRRVGCGGMDYAISIYDLHTSNLLFEKRFLKQVCTLTLGCDGVAVGCFGGHLEWRASLDLSKDHIDIETQRHNDARTMVRHLAKDVHTVALIEEGFELAVAAGSDVYIFCLRTQSVIYKLSAKGTVWGVSMARVIAHHIVLDGDPGGCLDLSSGVEVEEHGATSKWPHFENSVPASPPESNQNTCTPRLDVSSRSTGSPRMQLYTNKNAPVSPRRGHLSAKGKRRSFQNKKDESEKRTVIAEGILRISKVRTSKAGEIVLDTLESLPFLCLILLLVFVAVMRFLSAFKYIRFSIVSQYDRTALLLDLWITVMFVFEIIVRMLCILQIHHTLSKFFASPLCVADLLVMLGDISILVAGFHREYGGIPKVVRLAHASRLKQLLRLKRKRKDKRAGSSDHVSQMGEVISEAAIPQYDVHLPSGAIISNVPRTDVLSVSERQYVDFRHRAERCKSNMTQKFPSNADLSSSSQDSGYRGSFLLRFTKRRTSNENKEAVRRRIDPHLKASLGERDRMPVTVRIHALKAKQETRKFIAFGGDSQQASVWSYDLTEQQLEARPHQPNSDNYVSRLTGWCSDGENDASDEALDTLECERNFDKVSTHCGSGTTPIARQEWSMKFEHTVNSISLSGNVRRVAVCARHLTIVYDFDSRCVIFQHKSSDLVHGVQLCFLGDTILFGGASKRVQLHNVASGAMLYRVALNDRARCVALSRSGEIVAFGGFDAHMRVHHIDSGATGCVVECTDIVRSVSLDRDGTLLAVGGDDCFCHVYSLQDMERISAELWRAHHKAKVWVVAVEPSGKYVAAGDYANAVVVYEARGGSHVWQKTTWAGKGAPFTWSVTWSADGRYLAIGHWDFYAYLIQVQTWQQVALVERSDRVYGVALSADASLLCVGGRDKRAAVYRISLSKAKLAECTYNHAAMLGISAGGQTDVRGTGRNDKSHRVELSLDFETDPQGGFVYCIALSHDSAYLAIGCVDCSVSIYSLELRLCVAKISQDGQVQNLAFSPVSYDLAIASEQNYVEIWQLDEDRKGTDMRKSHRSPVLSTECLRPITKLVLRRHTNTHDVSLSATGFAYCSGTLFSTFGVGPYSPRWDDRMSFEMLQASLDHPKSLETILRQHPTMVNAQSPLSGESLLQYAVRKKTSATVDQLLGADCRVGLLADVNGNNALIVALEHERKNVLSHLLDATMDMLRNSPLVSRSFMDVHALIAEKYPDLYLDFLERATLIRDTALVPSNRNFALMPQHVTFVTAGSDEHSPRGFWDPFLLSMSAPAPCESLISQNSHAHVQNSTTAHSKRASCYGRATGSGTSQSEPCIGSQSQHVRSPVPDPLQAHMSELRDSSASIYGSVSGRGLYDMLSHSGILPLRSHTSNASNLTMTSMQSAFGAGEDPATVLHRVSLAHHAKHLSSAKKTEVVALRVPLEYVLGTYELSGPAQDSMLSLVAKSSAYLERYTVYGSALVQCIIQFKWDHYGRWIFLTEFALCIVHLAFVCILYFSMIDTLGMSWSARARAGPHGLITIVAFGPAVCMSSLFMGEYYVIDPTILLVVDTLCIDFACLMAGANLSGIEVRQFLIEGRKAYFAGHSHWKILDLACFGLQLFVDALLLSNVQLGVSFLAALNLLCFTSRVISFARGFEKWGPLVRMIVKIVYEVRRSRPIFCRKCRTQVRIFVGVVLVLIIGFCASFAILLRESPTVWLAVYLTNAGLYSHIAEERHLEPREWRSRDIRVVFLFQVRRVECRANAAMFPMPGLHANNLARFDELDDCHHELGLRRS